MTLDILRAAWQAVELIDNMHLSLEDGIRRIGSQGQKSNADLQALLKDFNESLPLYKHELLKVDTLLRDDEVAADVDSALRRFGISRTLMHDELYAFRMLLAKMPVVMKSYSLDEFNALMDERRRLLPIRRMLHGA